MSDVEKIKIGSTSYDIYDANAAHSLTDIAEAGNNIVFSTPSLQNFTTYGNPTIDLNNVISDFSSSDYVEMSDYFPTNSNYWFITAIKLSSIPSSNQVIFGRNDSDVRAEIGNDGKLILGSGTTLKTVNYTLSANVKYWLSIFYNGVNTYLAVVMDNNYTIDTLPNNFSASAYIYANLFNGSKMFLGKGYSGDAFSNGSIYLGDTALYNEKGGTLLWRAISTTPSNKKAINATIPTIATSVSSASTNAETVGAKLFYDTCGDIETLINAL